MFTVSFNLIMAAFRGWWGDRALSLGAAIAFYTVFSLAPMLLAIIAVAGLVFGREAAQGAIVAQIGGLIGVKEAEAIQAMIASASDFGSGVLGITIGIITFLLVATGAFVELQDDLNLIWKAKPSEASGVVFFIKSRLLSLAMLAAIGFLLLVSLSVDAALSAISSYLNETLPLASVVLQALNFFFALTVATFFFAVIFKFLPDVPIAWRDTWVGAFVTAALFTSGKFLIGLYLGRSGVASSYGAAASIITILLWVYYSSQILLFGAEFTKAYSERHGGRAKHDSGGSD